MFKLNYWIGVRILCYIGEHKGEYKGMLKNRKFVIIAVSKENRKAFVYDAQGQVVNYDRHLQTITLK
jgi:alpha-D-xyloside xylohydrolase